MAFMDAAHGVLATGWPYGTGYGGGSIALTRDGGRTWRTATLTPRPVVSVTVSGGAYVSGRAYIIQYDDGEMLRSRDGRTWQPWADARYSIREFSRCPLGLAKETNTGDWSWSLCTTQPSAGAQGKAVYRNLPDRGWVRVACTNFAAARAPCPGDEHGGIGGFGYGIGIAGSWDGFGLIWEQRGTLYVTRNGGRQWIGLDGLVAVLLGS